LDIHATLTFIGYAFSELMLTDRFSAPPSSQTEKCHFKQNRHGSGSMG
jgi:hypothetical protein